MRTFDINPELAKALVGMQGAVKKASKNKKGHNYKYADLTECWEACEDALQENGLYLGQFPVEAPTGHIGLDSILVHGPTGSGIGDTAFLPVKNASDPQAAGSGYTYLRRYALSAIVGLRTEDDDGSAARQSPANQKPPVMVMPDIPSIMNALKIQTSVATMKEMYQLNKAQPFLEPHKTNLLKQMADFIKEKQK